jgi:PAS domain S-box-containing protein
MQSDMHMERSQREGVLSVLLVEDNPGDASLIREAIAVEAEHAPLGVAVEQAASLAEARRSLADGRFDLVLLDLGLPDAEGPELVDRLRALAPGLPVLVLTGRDDVELGRSLVRGGAQGYLVKGKVEAFLYNALIQAVDRAALQRELQRAREREDHLNRVLRAIRRVNQLIVRERHAQRLLERACALLIETRSYRGAWMAVADADGHSVLTAQAGWAERFEPLARSLVAGRRPPCWRALSECRDTLLVRRPERDCTDCVLCNEYAGSLGVSARLTIEQRLAGVLAVAFPQQVATDEEELALLAEVAGDLGFAIEAIQTETRSRHTARRLDRAEQDLRFQAQLLAEIGDLVTATDLEGRITYVNDAVCRTLGRRSDELLGGSVDRILTADAEQADIQREIRERTLAAGRWSGRVVNHTTVGETVLLDCRTQLLRDADGRPMGMVGVSTDITERDRLEQRFHRSQRLESVGRLAGGVAHDFNNLLTIILSSAEFASDGVRKGDPLHEDLQQITEAGERAVTLTRQLLAFSRRQMMQPRIIDLNEVAGGLESMLGRLLGEDIALHFDLAPDLAPVSADPAQFEQVIMNLAVNARDAMPGGGRLTIESRNVVLDAEQVRRQGEGEPGPLVLLAVSDSGEGMDAATRERVFEPFFSTKSKNRGTGLGLATVYGIVRQSGGHIFVDSQPGRGTRFRILLPPAERPVESEIQAVARESLSTGAGETVLIVEDELQVLKLASRMLKRQGYTIIEARDGLEAETLSRTYEGRIDLLLTDVVMPGRSGRETAERLLEQRPGLRVCYMSGYTDETIARRGVLAPGQHFLEKPFSAKKLTAAVRRALDTPAPVA